MFVETDPFHLRELKQKEEFRSFSVEGVTQNIIGWCSIAIYYTIITPLKMNMEPERITQLKRNF